MARAADGMVHRRKAFRETAAQRNRATKQQGYGNLRGDTKYETAKQQAASGNTATLCVQVCVRVMCDLAITSGIPKEQQEVESRSNGAWRMGSQAGRIPSAVHAVEFAAAALRAR